MDAISGIQNLTNSMPQGVSGLINQVGSSDAVKKMSSAQVKEAADQFEAVFTSLLLKQLRSTISEEGGLFQGDSSDSYGAMFDMFLGEQMSKNRSLGVGDMVEEYLNGEMS